MKKLAAVFLCLALALGCAAAAEKESIGVVSMNGVFELKCALPEGYALSVISNETDQCIAMAAPEDSGKPVLLISIAFNDLYADVGRLNDLDPDSLDAIRKSFQEDEVEISTMTTAYGTELLVIRETDGDTDYVDFYTIYMGYEIELVLNHSPQEDAGSGGIPDIAPVTEEEIRMAVDFLSDLDFVAE